MTDVDHRQAAIDAAATALHKFTCRTCGADGTCTGRPSPYDVSAVKVALDAAAPHLAAAHEHTWVPCGNCPTGGPCACAGGVCCEWERRENEACAEGAAAERERIQQRFSEWIDAVASSPPEPGPPELWKAAFASLIDPDHPGKIIRQEAAGAP